MRRRIGLGVLAAVVVIASFVNAGGAAEKQRPNVLFIMSDDLRPDLGCYGNPHVKTPNLDAFAKIGVQFDRAYVQYPLCNPSRASMLNGRHPTTTGVMDNRRWFGAEHPEYQSLPMLFKRNGYASLRSGKVFHGGIDDFEAWTEGGEKRNFEGNTSDRKSPPNRAQTSDRIVTLEGDGESHGDYRTATKAIEFLREYKDKGTPFFLVCGFTKPHSPPTAPARFIEMYDAASIPLPPDFAAEPAAPAGFPERSITPNGDLFIKRAASEQEAREMIRAYWASVSWMDWNAGRVLTELDRLGLRDNTIVVFWGDHGYHLGEKGKWAKHGSLYEIGTRVPLIISAPGVAGNGKHSPRVVQSIDIYTTLADLCGLKVASDVEGRSLRPLLEDPEATWPHVAFTVYGSGGAGKQHPALAVRDERYRYADYPGGGAMLIDLEADPHEMKNLAGDAKYAEVETRMRKLVADFRAGKVH